MANKLLEEQNYDKEYLSFAIFQMQQKRKLTFMLLVLRHSAPGALGLQVSGAACERGIIY